MKTTTIHTIRGKYIDVRVDAIAYDDGYVHSYKVAYLYSRTKNQWRYVEKRDGSFFDYDRAAAIARAKRVIARNDPRG